MLPETIREAARRFGTAPAYVAESGAAVSYADLDQWSDEAAAGLAASGLRTGSVLGLVLPPSVEYVVTYLAAAKLGAITAGVNHNLAAPERAAVLVRAEPQVIVATPSLAPNVDVRVVELEPSREAGQIFMRTLRIEGGTPPALPPDPDRAVAIIFTSGTTGTPKGAVYGNRQLRAITATDVGDTWGGGGRSYHGTSFAHLGFMTKLPGNLQRGGTAFVTERWHARTTLELVEAQQMTTVGGVPSQFALMLGDEHFDDFDLRAVRYLIAGGGPITPGLAAETRSRFDARLATRYSCTEAGLGLGTAFDDPEEDAVLSVGRPHPIVDLRVMDDTGAAVDSGEVGEVGLRSPAVMSGYWRDPAATAAAFAPDGHVRTGDLGYVDDRGRLRLVGRTREMFVRGGENVYPVEVEAALSTHSGIAAVAVVPRPDPLMGEVGVAFVVPHAPAQGVDPVDLAGLRAHAADALARYKLPEELVIVDALPLTPGDKLDRAALRRRLEV